MNTQYLNLLEKCIGNELHGMAPRPISKHGRRHVWYGGIVNYVSGLFEKYGLQLCLKHVDGEGWPELGDTMLTQSGLRDIRNLLIRCDKEGIEGDFVECGVWRGGACVYAKAVINELKSQRGVLGFDSFEGLPRPSDGDCRNDKHHTYSALAVSLEEVKRRAQKYDVGKIFWLKGFFHDTLSLIEKDHKIAILRCDGDMYSSTKAIFEFAYPKVVEGGFVIVDDWKLQCCRDAIRDSLGFMPDVVFSEDNQSVMFRKYKN